MATEQREECDLPISQDNKYGGLVNFVIDKKIGKGQFSEVYRAKYIIDNSIVALKKVQVLTPFYILVVMVTGGASIRFPTLLFATVA